MEAGVVIVGAGAAGLAAAIFAGERAAETGISTRIIVVDGAKKPGAKILVSGGGRCNVTNERVTAADFSGGPQPLIRNVLRAFDEQRTLAWMRSLGVRLKLEPTGKYFPESDQARTVLDALLNRSREVGCELWAGQRVQSVEPRQDGDFHVQLKDASPIQAKKVILATGGLALPKSGSDGAGLAWARKMGHTIVPTTPALVPLLLAPEQEPALQNFTDLAGLTLVLRLELKEKSGKKLASVEGSTLFTHFGISGPGPLDFSRHLLRQRLENPAAPAEVNLGHPRFEITIQADAWLQAEIRKSPRKSPLTQIAMLYPERLARHLTHDLPDRLGAFDRAQRHELARRLTALRLNIAGHRGYSFAETTAGGVELREVDVRTMESRVVPGLHLCGEMLDVDGRIGGFNFQWAWASGYLAGRGAVTSLQ